MSAEAMRLLRGIMDAARAYFGGDMSPDERDEAARELDRAIAEANAFIAQHTGNAQVPDSTKTENT